MFSWPMPVLLLMDKILNDQPKPRYLKRMDLNAPDYEDPVWVQTLREQKANLLFFCRDVKGFSESTAFTMQRLSLWRHNKSNVPIPIQGAFAHEELPNIGREKIKGNLLLLKDGMLDDLDIEMQKGVNFERKSTNVIIPLIDWEGNPTRLTAWMYVAKPELRDRVIWDARFYRGGRDYSLAQTLEDRARQWIGRFYQHHNSNGEDYRKCFLYVHRGLNDPSPAQPKPVEHNQPTQLIIKQAIIK